VKTYTYLNAILYVLFGACPCAGQHLGGIGFLDLSSGGKSRNTSSSTSKVDGVLAVRFLVAGPPIPRTGRSACCCRSRSMHPSCMLPTLHPSASGRAPSSTFATGTLELGLLIATLAIYRRAA
jgi:hypothetical protein